jgi:hypothetical protein
MTDLRMKGGIGVPFMHLDSFNIAEYFENCSDDFGMAMIISHTEDEEGALLDIQNETDVLTECFRSFGRDNFSVQVADLCRKAADTLRGCESDGRSFSPGWHVRIRKREWSPAT